MAKDTLDYQDLIVRPTWPLECGILGFGIKAHGILYRAYGICIWYFRINGLGIWYFRIKYLGTWHFIPGIWYFRV